ncbi:MAG: ABC transporter ATP-binding protein [Bacilli bacterium]|nr:ABC transporter ATP-binding protein [Bacilli bacterium]MBN2877093.1 ABC transporter ATP-binding protein [Bacilli bacterium]
MKLMFSYLKPYWKGVIVVFLLVAAIAISGLLLPDYMSKILGEGISAEYSTEVNGVWYTMPAGTSCDPLLDTCSVKQVSDFTVIAKYSAIMLGVTFVSSLAAIALMKISSRIGTNVSRDLRSDLYKKVNALSVAETSKFGTSTLITRATNDVTQVQNFMMMLLRMVLQIPIMMIGGVIFALRKSASLTGSLGIGVLTLFILIAVVFVFVAPLFKQLQKKIDRLTMVTRESINGVRVIRAFGQGDQEVERFEEANIDLNNLQLKTGRIMAVLNPSVNLVFNVVMVGILYTAYNLVFSSTIIDYQGIANISAIFQYSMQIMFSVLMLTMTFIMYPRAQVTANRIKEVLKTETTIFDTGSEEYNDYEFKGEVVFDDVNFRFPEAETDVLCNISLTAKPGETIAIIGSTGSGKSTIVNLIPRLFDISAGSLTIDGVPIKDIKLSKLRSLIGFVPQQALLFSGTLRDNIAFGKENATDEEIAEAAEIAQAKDFIESLEAKYNAEVEQGGVNFSGGQKQRISIARSIVRKPKIYIFDDSFSALDFKTDSNLRKALKQNVKDATVFIVAQRIGTIMDADRIVVLQEGKIVGYGSHRELLKDCDVYREIALSQMDEEELA